jgi:hypothetical protein
MKFLSHMRPTWNISLFHYRNQGADYGRILVGMQVPASDGKAFQAFLDTLGYPYVEETDQPGLPPVPAQQTTATTCPCHPSAALSHAPCSAASRSSN